MAKDIKINNFYVKNSVLYIFQSLIIQFPKYFYHIASKKNTFIIFDFLFYKITFDFLISATMASISIFFNLIRGSLWQDK
jgi:hypothetical protein